MNARSFVSACLSSFALSNVAIFWASLIGGFSTLVLVPGVDSPGLFTWQWMGVVVVSQFAFALTIFVMRRLGSHLTPKYVLVTLVVSGAVRGLIIGIDAGLLGVHQLAMTDVLNRTANSAVITVIGVGLIGGTLAWRADYREQYQLLKDRSLLLESGKNDPALISPSVLESWTSIKLALDLTLQRASDQLLAGSSAHELASASRQLSSAVDLELRPVSRALWRESEKSTEPVRLPALLKETIGTWRIPLKFIVIFLGVTVGIGSLVRSGLINGGIYTLRYILLTTLILWVSVGLARRWPQLTALIGMATLLAMPFILIASDQFIGRSILQLPRDFVGQLIVAVATPWTVLFIAMADGALRDRQHVLDALQLRIDRDILSILDQGGAFDRDAQRLSVFVHHSIQSELSALAMQLSEAALTNDEATMDSVRLNVLERLDEITALDPVMPPWLRTGSGRDHIGHVVSGWRGILEISVDLPEPAQCRPDQWHVAAQIIEEALANAARHGQASHVTIEGTVEREILVLRIIDDGVVPRGWNEIDPGVGLKWLDRIAPGNWSLQQSEAGVCLSVDVR